MKNLPPISPLQPRRPRASFLRIGAGVCLALAASLCLAPASAPAANLRIFPKFSLAGEGRVSVTCPIYLIGAPPSSNYVAVFSSHKRCNVQTDALGSAFITTLRETVAHGSRVGGTVSFFSTYGMNRGQLSFAFPANLNPAWITPTDFHITLSPAPSPPPAAAIPSPLPNPLPPVFQASGLTGTWTNDGTSTLTVLQSGDALEVTFRGGTQASGYIEGGKIHLWDVDLQ